jgi:hypothetical protein
LISHLNLLWVFLISIFLLLLMLSMMLLLVLSMMNHLMTMELIFPKSTQVGCYSILFMLLVWVLRVWFKDHGGCSWWGSPSIGTGSSSARKASGMWPFKM